VDFFDDDASGQRPPADTPSPERPARRSNRRRTRIQRIVILAAILFLIVFALAWWARSCQQNRKVGSYRSYLTGVSTAISDSAALGRQLDQLVANPTKFSRKQLIGKLNELSDKQAEIAVRADRLEPPGTLKTEQGVFATGMKVRSDGFKLLRTAMTAALGKKKVTPAVLSALSAYFAGPDAYYMDLFYTPTRKVMSDDGVTDVAVPTSTSYLTAKTFDRARLESMLSRVGSSSKLSGIHGVGLVSVVATTESGKVPLATGKTVNVPASAQLSFVVKVQNQGDVAEKKVPVVATLTLPGGASPLVQNSSIATIAPGQAQSVTIQGFAIPSSALSKICTLKVKAGPVPEERVLSNNTGTYKFLLQLK
jgi:hypothetical protein